MKCETNDKRLCGGELISTILVTDDFINCRIRFPNTEENHSAVLSINNDCDGDISSWSPEDNPIVIDIQMPTHFNDNYPSIEDMILENDLWSLKFPNSRNIKKQKRDTLKYFSKWFLPIVDAR